MTSFSQRLMGDVRRSPGRAAMLGAGLLVASLVWGPHVKAMFKGSPNKNVHGVAAPTGTTELSTDSPSSIGRDASVIRDEFIAISREARALGRLTVPPPIPEIERDPFESDLIPRAVAMVTEVPPEDPENERDSLERDAVKAMVLRGVLIDGDRGTAMFADRVVPVGGRYRGFLVVSLKIDAVILAGEREVYELRTTRRDDASEQIQDPSQDGGEEQ